MEKNDIQKIIKMATSAAVGDLVKMIDEKIKEAVELGISVGAKAGAEAAIKTIEKEKKKARKKQYDWRLYNTKLLMKHYRALNNHHLNAIYDTSKVEADESFYEIMQKMNSDIPDEELRIESIKKSCMRTKVIMAHVNKVLDIYKTMCEKSEREDDARHWRVLESYCIADKQISTAMIAKEEGIAKRTVYKDLDVCFEDLTVLLFGVDGIDKL